MTLGGFTPLELSTFAMFCGGVACFLRLGLDKDAGVGTKAKAQLTVAGFLLIGAAACLDGWAINRSDQESTVTPVKIAGVLIDLHTVSHQRGSTLHFAVQCDACGASQDLHTEEPVMFMKAEDGQQVEATFEKETGYVSQFRIVAGPGTGYAYDEPGSHGKNPGTPLCAFGVLLLLVGMWRGFSDF